MALPLPAPSLLAPVPSPGSGRIKQYLAEILELGPAEIRAVGIGLEANATGTVPGVDTYKVPSDQDLVILSLQGYLQFQLLNTEPTAILTWLNLDPSERWFVKTQNCEVSLENIDRSLEVFDARSVPLSAISPPVGAPLYFNPELPFIIPAGHSLRGTFTLKDTTTAIVGAATNYGILLGGALIPKRS